MKYFARIKRLDENIEQEVDLEINGIDLTCFALVCPFKIEEGCTYWVDLSAGVLDDYQIKVVEDSASASIVKLDNSFAHVITGKLCGDHLKSKNIEFEDDVLSTEYQYLDGKMVSWTVDRIDVAFHSAF